MLNEGFWFVMHIDNRDAGTAVLAFLSARYPYRDWPTLVARGNVTVDGAVVVAPEVPLRAGDVVRFFREPWREPLVDRRLDVAFEDDELIVCIKRKGYPIVPHGDFLRTAFLNIVRDAGHPEAAPLHRLGRGTTGAIVFAKNTAAAKKWCRRFAERDVKKVYRCVVVGDPPWDAIDAECYIGPVPHEGCNGGVFAAVEAGSSKSARVARTRFSVVARGPGWAVLDADIATGRPHQIRIMTGFVGFPLLGDPLYGVGGVPLPGGIVFDDEGHDRPAAPGDTGYLLHSMRLEIGHVVVNVKPPNLDEWAPYYKWVD